jgi:hypothetical protein
VCAHIISVTLNTPAWTLLLLADWLARLWSRPATLDRTFVSISIYVSLARFFFLLFPVGSVALASGNETATPLDAHSAPVKRDGMTVGAGAGQTWTRSHSV